jgi:hypothetical protein
MHDRLMPLKLSMIGEANCPTILTLDATEKKKVFNARKLKGKISYTKTHLETTLEALSIL